MSDYNKYLKYKMKYIALKNMKNQNGGSRKEKPELYLFKASWCGHCNAFKDTWKSISTNEDFVKKIDFVTYDSEKDKDIMTKFNIQGFPTLILKTDSQLIEYNGTRSESEIKKFINKNT